MKALVVVGKGTEKIAALEVKEILGLKADIKSQAVVFSPKKHIELCKLCYLSQSASRVLLLLAEVDIAEDYKTTLANISKELPKIDFSEWLDQDNTFKVECEREGKHDFNSSVIEKSVGELIIEHVTKKLGFSPKTDMKNQDTTIYLYIVDRICYICIDFAGFDLGKRDYRIISYTPSLRAPNAYALLRFADYKPKQVLVDPFSHSGLVAIEAAFFAASKPINFYRKSDFSFLRLKPLKNQDFDTFYQKRDSKTKQIKSPKIHCLSDQFRFIKAAKSNSKAAGINKAIAFSRFEIEWLDTKFEARSVDLIAGNAPRESKMNRGMLEKLYSELFYQAKYVLKSKGKVAILTNISDLIEKAASSNGFKLLKSQQLWQGKEELKVVVFQQKPKSN